MNSNKYRHKTSSWFKARNSAWFFGEQPINGLRHVTENGVNGWYIWCGAEMSEEESYFSPLHIEHVKNYLPQVAKYLDLPPGYRFLIDDNGYEDVWFDPDLLKI